MLINWRKFKFISCILFFMSRSLTAIEMAGLEKSNEEIIASYLANQESFMAKMCAPGVTQEFESLMTNFRGDGRFIPFLTEGDLDKDALLSRLPIFKEKKKWLENLVDTFSKKKNFNELNLTINKLEKQLNLLLEMKKKYLFSKSDVEKNKIEIQSKYEYLQFRENVKKFLKIDLFWLHTFQFPLDHLALRDAYDKYKEREDLEGKKKSNGIYLYRKIVEDGAQNEDHTSNDIQTRALINTLYLKLSAASTFIEEEIRYDFEDLVKTLRFHLSKGKEYSLKRLNEWKARGERDYGFYSSLLEESQGDGFNRQKVSEIFSSKERSRAILSRYVLDKEADTYLFWKDKRLIDRALYSLDTILINEVGDVEGAQKIERENVTKVVINRTLDKNYSAFSNDDPLLHALRQKGLVDTVSYKWLNTLFKQGEFSFTYFFIPGSFRIFCPDMSRRAVRLRYNNLQIALKMLREVKESDGVLRYFSRASMLGRIDMAVLWKGYKSMAQGPGRQMASDERVKSQFRKGKYRYLYSFQDREERKYHVIEIGDQLYNIGPQEHVFHHRNPHFFRYFKRF